jgi:hypothetical protein
LISGKGLPRDKTKGCRERRGKPFCRQIGIKEQYGNIVEPKPSQVSPNHPNRSDPEVICNHELTLILNHLALSISSPEKAGVGGSIPSLATIKSVVYRPPDSQFHSNSFQNQNWSIEFCLRVDLCVWSVCSRPQDSPSRKGKREGRNLRSGEHRRPKPGASAPRVAGIRYAASMGNRSCTPSLQETAYNPRRPLKVTLSVGTNGRRQGAVYRPAGLGAGCRIIAIRAPSRYSKSGMTPRTPEG